MTLHPLFLKIIPLLKRHWMAFLVSLLATVHVMLPTVAGRLAAGDTYQNVYYSDNGDWFFYVARIRDLSAGYSGGNPFLFEHQSDTHHNIPGSEMALAFIVRIFHIDPINLQIALDIIAPFIVTLLLYGLLYRLSHARWLSTAIPLFLLATNIWDLDKPVHPQIDRPLFLLFILGWFSLLSQLDKQASLSTESKSAGQKKWPTVFLCGVILGTLYFVYFFHWSYLYVVLGCSALCSLFQRKLAIARINILIISVSSPFAIIFLQKVIEIARAPLHQDLLIRGGVYYSHLPATLPRLGVAILACLLVYGFLRSAKLMKSHLAQGVFALLLANAIYPNQQVITGVSMLIPEHWSSMPILIYAIVAAYMYPFVHEPPTTIKKTAKIFAVAFFLLFIVASLRLSHFLAPPVTTAKLKQFVSAQRYGPVFRYLQQSTPADSVVLSNNQQLLNLIPAFTNNNIYYHPIISGYPASNQELMERYILSHQFNPTFFQDGRLGIVDARSRVIWRDVPALDQDRLYRLLRLPPIEKYTFEHEQRLAKDALRELQASGKITFESLIKYRLDYVIWDKRLHPDWTFAQAPQLTKIFEAQDLIIYAHAK